MRARGESLQTYGVDEIIEQNGVVKGSYDEVQLPKIRAFNVMYKHPSMTKPAEAFEVKSTPLPPTLEWGQVLINVKAASIGPGDIHPLFASSMDPGASIFEAVHFFSNPNFLTLSSNSHSPSPYPPPAVSRSHDGGHASTSVRRGVHHDRHRAQDGRGRQAAQRGRLGRTPQAGIRVRSVGVNRRGSREGSHQDTDRPDAPGVRRDAPRAVRGVQAPGGPRRPQARRRR